MRRFNLIHTSTIAHYLSNVCEQAKQGGILSFVSHLLQLSCPADEDGSGLRAMIRRLGPDIRDALNDLKQEAINFGDGGAGLIGFIHYLEQTNPEIRREGAAEDNVVRLMTVHGSKGLEAPIVILPDTIHSANRQNGAKLYWPKITGAALPVMVAQKGDLPDSFEILTSRVEQAEIEENDRLLYVALTRARDKLIIAGAVGSRQRLEGSWYESVMGGFAGLKERNGYSEEANSDGVRLVYTVPQTAVIPDGDDDTGGRQEIPPLPSYFTMAPAEPALARPLRPERATGGAGVLSPLQVMAQPETYHRGLIIHKLLQVIPTLSGADRDVLVRQYIERHGEMLDPQVRKKMGDDVIGLLTSPDYAGLFIGNSLAEVPLTGMTSDARLIAGQIDRLCIFDDRVEIIDYKTDVFIPHSLDRVPIGYIHQMRAYRDLLRQIYHDRKILCRLLWTGAPSLMLLPDHVLDGA